MKWLDRLWDDGVENFMISHATIVAHPKTREEMAKEQLFLEEDLHPYGVPIRVEASMPHAACVAAPPE